MLIDAILITMLMAMGWVVLRLQVKLQLAQVMLQAVEGRVHDLERAHQRSAVTSLEIAQPFGAQVF